MFYDIRRIMKGSSIRREQVFFCHQSMDIFAPCNVALPSTHGVTLRTPCRCWVSKSWPATRTASSRSWRSDSTVRSKLGPGLGLAFREPHPWLACPAWYRIGPKEPATNQQAKRLFMQFAVKCEGNHSRWRVGNGTTRWAATYKLQMESWSPNKRPKIHGWKGSKNGQVIIIRQTFRLIFGVSIGKIEFKSWFRGPCGRE